MSTSLSEAIGPLPAQPHSGAEHQGFHKTQLLKEVRPCLDLRLDTSRLLDRGAIAADTRFNAERHFRQLLVRSGEQVSGDEVWLRVSPYFRGSLIECFDQAAHDLEPCAHTFLQIARLQDKVGFLEELASPSFSGRKAMALVWNLMAIAGIDEAFFIDGSTMLPSSGQRSACCEYGAPTALRSLGAFTDGKSWYEKQGAIAQVSQRAFRSLITEFEDDLVFEEKIVDPRMSKAKDFDKMVFERSALYVSEMQPSHRAYRSACQFLNSLPTGTFNASLSPLSEWYSSSGKLLEVMNRASSATSTTGSLGEFMSAVMAMKGCGEAHALHHEVRDRLVAGKGSIFSQYASDALIADTLPTEISCALAWAMIGSFLSLLGDFMKYPAEDAVRIFFSLLNADDEKLEAMSKEMRERVRKEEFPDEELPAKIEPMMVQIRQKVLREFENSAEIASVKVRANTNHVQIQRFLRYSKEMEILTEEPLTFVQQSLHFLTRMPLARLASAYPELIDRLTPQFQIGDETTLEELLHAARGSEREWIMFELLFGHYKHVSALFVRYLDHNPQDAIPTENVYPLFLLSKYICNQRHVFTLKLQ